MRQRPINDNVIWHNFDKAKHDRDTAFSLVFMPIFSLTFLSFIISVAAIAVSITAVVHTNQLQTDAVYKDEKIEKNSVEIEAIRQLVLEERHDAVGNNPRQPH